jgi:flagella basal body P-ring formation protein FlgA
MGVGRTIVWTADAPGMFVTETYRSEPRRGDMVRVRMHSAEKIVDATAGELLTTGWA